MDFSSDQQRAIAPDQQGPETLLRLLTPVELHILILVSLNWTSKSIAQELHASYRTVQNHRLRMCRKLGLAGYNRLFQFSLEHKSTLQFFPPSVPDAPALHLSTSTPPK
jgi:DNA-binding CsgD family transcriptional regulator